MVLKKRFTSLLKRSNSHEEDISPDADTPEANAARGVRLFCESGAANTGEEVLHLPTIVEAAVASPGAAQSAASQIRKFLSKENYSRPHVQYNAVMLIRILADNPGPSFTKHMDKQFADTVKHLLRSGQDPSVSQILRESLDALDRDKAYDTNLNALFAMWRKEKTLMANAAKQFGPRTMNAPVWNGTAPQGGFGQQGGGGGGGGRGRSSDRRLPAPVELAGRIEEARTSAKLLLQLVQSTPPNELLGNDLVKEFSERCMSAQRSVQGYINCDNPPPDDDTMLTLIETNEQLSLAASKHQRAVLQARRLQGPVPSPPIPQSNTNNFAPVPPPANSNYSAAPVPFPGSPYNAPTQASNDSYNPPALAPTTSYSPPPQPPRSEAPYLPAIDVAPMDHRAPETTHQNELHFPSSLQAGGGNRRPASSSNQEDDDPFADHHSPRDAAPSGPQSHEEEAHSQPNPETFQAYHPGAQSTPSYLGRQESSSNNLTMHGAAPSTMTEEDEYARDYPAGAAPKTPEQGHQHRQSDVSPIAERGTVTYRY